MCEIENPGKLCRQKWNYLETPMAHKREDNRSRRRDDYVSRATKLFEEYQTIIVIEMDEVTSKQLQDLRQNLRETAEMFVSVNVRKICFHLIHIRSN